MVAIIQIDQRRQVEQSDDISLPKYLQTEKEITDMAEFSARGLAKRVFETFGSPDEKSDDEARAKKSDDEQQ